MEQNEENFPEKKKKNRVMRKFKGKKKFLEKRPYVRHRPIVLKKKEIDPRKKLLRERSRNNNKPMDQTLPRNWNSHRFIGPVIRYLSIKYGVSKDDFTLFLNMYNSSHFTREEFERASLLNSGTTATTFRRFLKSGFIIPVMHTVFVLNYSGRKKAISTDRFRLSNQVVERVKFFYRINDNIEVLNEEEFDPFLAHPGIINMVNKFEREIKDFKKGRKQVEKIVPGKD